MKINCERILVIFGALAIIALAIGLPFISKPSEELLPNFSLAQLAFSAVAFFIIFLTLYFTIVQLRKSMAKPKLEVIFGNTGNAETILDILKEVEIKHKLELAVLNKGNAITNYFQIDFYIPSIYKPGIANWAQLTQGTPYTQLFSKLEIPKDETIVPFYNNRQITCFVNKITEIPSLSIRITPENIKEHTKIEIRYKIYGDWAETQEGTLKVKINKQ